MALKWGARRQILYYGVGIILLAILAASAWRVFFYQVPMCTDGVQNGDESGVDCGGTCAALCPDTAHAPTIQWSRAFLTAPGIYTAAAYIQNNNVAVGAGAKHVKYSFQLLDKDNILVAEREGYVDIPPVQTVPIVETNINTGTREVARTFFNFETNNAPISWSRVSPSSVQKVRISATGNYDSGRLSATIANDSYDDAKNITALAVLFDGDGVARAASKATIAKVPHRGEASVTFTWPQAPQNIIRAEVTVLPSF
jgi:hypothetical protein